MDEVKINSIRTWLNFVAALARSRLLPVVRTHRSKRAAMATHSLAGRRRATLVLVVFALAGCGTDHRAATSDAIVVQAPSAQGNGVFMIDTDGSVGRRLDPGTSSAKHPDWSPDGSEVVFVDDSDGSLWTVGVDGSTPKRLLSCDDGCFYLDFPAYSPDGTRIAYTRYEPPSGDGAPSASSIHVLDLQTGESTEVVRSEQPELVDVPRWSPDGRRLVVGIDQFDDALYESGSTIGVIDANGGDLRRLVDASKFAYGPDWSESGIVFSVETREYRKDPQSNDDTWDLFVVQPDGTGLRAITRQAKGSKLLQPAWLPDGQRIVATLQTGSATKSRIIVSVDLRTGSVTPISTELATHPRPRP